MQWIALCLLVLSGVSRATEVYHWRDAEGVLHFEDLPPPAIEADKRPVAEPSVIEAWRAEMRVRPRPVRPVGTPRAAVVEARRAREEKRSEKCHQARQRLAEIRAKRRSGYKASEGRSLRRRLDRYQADVRFYCGTWN